MDIQKTYTLMNISILKLTIFGTLICFILSCCYGINLSRQTTGRRCESFSKLSNIYVVDGTHEVSLTETQLSGRGKCVEELRNYYLFLDRSKKCFKCIRILQVHNNILHMKEGICFSEGNLAQACSTVTEIARTSILVQAAAEPSRCPFIGNYLINYSDMDHGFCDVIRSRANVAANQTSYKLSLNHCVSAAALHNTETSLECLGHWSESRLNFLYGKLNGSEYRCFIFSMPSDDRVFLSMNADGTCEGLYNSTRGSFIMELQIDSFNWPMANCEFPTWVFQHQKWLEIMGGSRFKVTQSGQLIEKWFNVRSQPEFFERSFKCLILLDNDENRFKNIYLVATFYDWTFFSQCLRLTKLADGVVQIQQGRRVEHSERRTCVIEDPFYGEHIIMGENLSPVPCPNPGFYHTAVEKDCVYRVDIGCIDERTIHVRPLCQPQLMGMSMSCLAAWPANASWIILTHIPATDTISCYILRETSNFPQLEHTIYCDYISNGIIQYEDQTAYSLVRKDECESATGQFFKTKQTGTSYDYVLPENLDYFPNNNLQSENKNKYWESNSIYNGKPDDIYGSKFKNQRNFNSYENPVSIFYNENSQPNLFDINAHPSQSLISSSNYDISNEYDDKPIYSYWEFPSRREVLGLNMRDLDYKGQNLSFNKSNANLKIVTINSLDNLTNTEKLKFDSKDGVNINMSFQANRSNTNLNIATINSLDNLTNTYKLKFNSKDDVNINISYNDHDSNRTTLDYSTGTHKNTMRHGNSNENHNGNSNGISNGNPNINLIYEIPQVNNDTKINLREKTFFKGWRVKAVRTSNNATRKKKKVPTATLR